MQHRYRFSHFLVSLVVLPMLAGCVNLKPKENTTRFYVLGGTTTQATPRQAPELPKLRIGLRRLRLAEYLDSPFIVFRYGTNEVRFSEQHRWGEDLRHSINRTVAQSLASRSTIQQVDVVPWASNSEHDFIIQLQVLRFEGVADKFPRIQIPEREGRLDVHLLAKWLILDPQTNEVLREGITDVLLEGKITDDVYSGAVSGLNKALDRLSEDLQKELLTL